MVLKNKIRRYRFENNEMSQEELAQAVGVTRQTIHSIEKNKFIPSTLLAFKLALHFGVRVDELFYLDDKKKSVKHKLTDHGKKRKKDAPDN